MAAVYNENDKFCADWLENLIAEGLIADGEVDRRSIEDVVPNDYKGFTQVHLFAGIGLWSYCLREAGYPDDRPVGTFSCPCQPFSAAGKGEGFADERHLWPAAWHVLGELGFDTLFGEQVASPDGLTWLDLVSDDLEGAHYAIGTNDLCATGFGAPEIRQRLNFAADLPGSLRRLRADGGLAGPDHTQRGPETAGRHFRDWPTPRRGQSDRDNGARGGAGGLADTSRERRNGLEEPSGPSGRHGPEGSSRAGGLVGSLYPRLERHAGYEIHAIRRTEPPGPVTEASPTRGFWRAADWLLGRDGLWRPVEPGTFPMAPGRAETVGLLRAYGNCIVTEQTINFIECYLEEEAEAGDLFG